MSRAATLLGLGWDAVHSIIERAVARGLDRRNFDSIKHVGMDEKSFGKGHDYVSVLTDIDHRRVLEVTPDRTIAAADKLWETLSETQLSEIESVSMDMWQAFMTSAGKQVSKAEKFFKRWYSWAIRSRLAPIKKVAVMLKNHLGGLLSYFRHGVTNATAEGFNSRIQSIKSAARGCRSFKNYRLRVLFYCGKLELMPKTCP